jgi:3-oxoacyl-[acyl-carrier-protein] synthase-3
MAFLSFPNIRVAGISACVPKEIEDNWVSPLYSEEERSVLINSVGIFQRRRSPEGVCSSDLCFSAAERLLDELEVNRSEIGALVFVSQTPDYILPATACVLQERLGLSQECLAFDISLGCSGWVYGMSVMASLMSFGTVKKGLLMVGDLATRTNSPKSKSEALLFGDAGTCTLLEYAQGSAGFKFHLATDGAGKDAILVPEGGYRNPFRPESLKYKDYGNGDVRTGLHAQMDGMSVFSFAISKAPKSVRGLCEYFSLDINAVDCFVFHQANKMITSKIIKKLKIEEEKCPISMDHFGNTSCATIPLTLVTRRRKELVSSYLKLIGCAFGVGLSWGTIYLETDHIVVPELIEL